MNKVEDRPRIILDINLHIVCVHIHTCTHSTHSHTDTLPPQICVHTCTTSKKGMGIGREGVTSREMAAVTAALCTTQIFELWPEHGSWDCDWMSPRCLLFSLMPPWHMVAESPREDITGLKCEEQCLVLRPGSTAQINQGHYRSLGRSRKAPSTSETVRRTGLCILLPLTQPDMPV